VVTPLLMVLYVLFGRVFPWSLAVTIVLVLGRRSRSWVTVILVLLIGILEDVTHMRPLGLGSLVLVTLMTIAGLIESQYRSRLLWWWYGLGIMGEFVFRLVEGQSVTITSIVTQVLALVVCYWLSKRFGDGEGIYVGS